MKRCPYCAEKIHDEAVFCRYCGRDTRVPVPQPEGAILAPGLEPSAAAPPLARDPWLGRFRVLAVLLGLLGILWIGTVAILWMGRPLAGTQDAEILAVIFQLVYRLLIGICAVKEFSRSPSVTSRRRAAVFVLAFLPLVSLFAMWYAARNLIREHLFPAFVVFDALTAAMTLSIIGLLVAASLSAGEVIPAHSAPAPTAAWRAAVPSPTATEAPLSAVPSQAPPAALRTSPAPCLAPSQVSASDQGRTVQVCGRITAAGKADCAACPFGQYSYLTLEGGFQILSYDWSFESGWVGNCVTVSDIVQLLAGRPVFVYRSGEGFAGSRCVVGADGGETCEGGSYWQWFTCPTEGSI